MPRKRFKRNIPILFLLFLTKAIIVGKKYTKIINDTIKLKIKINIFTSVKNNYTSFFSNGIIFMNYI